MWLVVSGGAVAGGAVAAVVA
eukprot:SAG25_NODE_3497_length_1062_cov_0.831776_2_plen_20_part_01